MATSSIRVLIVDDFEPFRGVLRATLQRKLNIKYFHEACDGLDAVRKAQELQPDLILLDVGLPHINGIEAARRIRALCPNSKIIFVSQQSGADVIESALKTGAQGYVVKTDVASDLLSAVDAVMRSMTFVSPRFGPNRGDGASDRLHNINFCQHNSGLHRAGFYSDDASCCEDFAHFLPAP